MRRTGWLLLVATLSTAIGCTRHSYAPIETGTIYRVIVRSLQDTVAVINDRGRIADVIAFVNANRTGWYGPAGGVPIPRLSVDLMRGDSNGEQFLGAFGVCGDCFEAHGLFPGGVTFKAKRASKDDHRAFARVLGMPLEDFARYMRTNASDYR